MYIFGNGSYHESWDLAVYFPHGLYNPEGAIIKKSDGYSSARDVSCVTVIRLWETKILHTFLTI